MAAVDDKNKNGKAVQEVSEKTQVNPKETDAVNTFDDDKKWDNFIKSSKEMLPVTQTKYVPSGKYIKGSEPKLALAAFLSIPAGVTATPHALGIYGGLAYLVIWAFAHIVQLLPCMSIEGMIIMIPISIICALVELAMPGIASSSIINVFSKRVENRSVRIATVLSLIASVLGVALMSVLLYIYHEPLQAKYEYASKGWSIAVMILSLIGSVIAALLMPEELMKSDRFCEKCGPIPVPDCHDQYSRMGPGIHRFFSGSFGRFPAHGRRFAGILFYAFFRTSNIQVGRPPREPLAPWEVKKDEP
ncbi:hypothetical protein JW948_08440 [bacterium]|nr:hypothetical protein [bacterium]